jgi:hypothetical protein
MLMFETRAVVQMALDDCETARRALDGDERALARAYHDANEPLSRFVALIRSWLASAARSRRIKRASTSSERATAASRLA